MFHLALARLWKFIHEVNAYFHGQEPWKLAKQERDQFVQVLSATCHSLRVIAILLWPVMPNKMATLLDSLGITFDPKNNTLQNLELGAWNQRFTLKKIPPLFAKPEIKKETMQAKKEPDEHITIDDVSKIELRVGTIEACESVAKSEKLYRMQVDFGDFGKRQVLAGIKKFYNPEDLMNKQGVFIFNLKPRKMLGLESQGMMLVAEDEAGNLQLISPTGPVPNGTRLR